MDNYEKIYTFEELRQIICCLRSPSGCPWDREQTHESLRGCMVEEAYEVVEGIRILTETGSSDNLCEELGDVLLQVLMHSCIAEEEGLFCFEDVVQGISAKMVRRHPHVFGDKAVDDSEQVLVNWEEIKRREKKDRPGEQGASAVPRSLPALIRAAKVQKKLEQRAGGYADEAESLRRLQQTVANLDEPLSAEEEKQRIAGILLDLCNISRRRGINAEQALADSLEEAVKSADFLDKP